MARGAKVDNEFDDMFRDNIRGITLFEGYMFGVFTTLIIIIVGMILCYLIIQYNKCKRNRNQIKYSKIESRMTDSETDNGI